MPMSNKPPLAWAQSMAWCTWVRFFPNSARTTRRSPRVPWAGTDLRASTAGKKWVQMACRQQREESRMQKGKKGVRTQELTNQFFSFRGPNLEGVPAAPQSPNKTPPSSFCSPSVPKLCPAPDTLCPLLSSPLP